MNVIIADHQAIFRAGIAKVLAVEDDIRIIGQPQSMEQMLVALHHLRPHVLLIASGFLPAFHEIDAITRRNQTAILVVAESTDDPSAFVALGVKGVIYRCVDGPTAVGAVRRVARGESFLHCPNTASGSLSDDVVGARVRDRLSSKELTIIAAVVRGCKNREIAERLFTTEQMVKNALRLIFDKVGVGDRLELALFVLHHHTLAHATANIRLDAVLPAEVRPVMANGGNHRQAS